jgi:elongation factor G
VLSYAIEPKSRGDEDKISTSMHRLEEEDPSISYSRDPQTKELLLSGQGQLHIEVTVAKLKRRFGVDVNLKPPRIPYRETIKAPRKRTAPQKADRRSRPVRRLQDQGGAARARSGLRVRRRYLRRLNSASVHPGRGKRDPGNTGARLSSRLPDGRFPRHRVRRFYHDVDSNELSFKMAGRLAFRDAMTRARPTILEPIMNVEVYAPSDFAGDLMGDLNGRRGRIAGMDTRGATTVIKAQVPMAEMLTYEQHLTSATGARGSYHMEFSHYDEVPSPLQSKIIAASKAERGAEVEAE